ncbi:phosphate:H+ symporter [Spizellomyces punctatus DAOM BR117]|uniref:Phosphate:H+ symporter n=1 Tax=Spizellomyces punctatus (strain DAOM BR117) TaxID=645134 RepID=A0A0L0HDX5_SPIPD|nr:phosphate:H+ symporter [Spizellomyces punctatus DAOM BR117]KNC99650.1 phosphate:H+ symporter [Spizellomyces punctatus DAOM BR117]|eukprot:XP_016607690.1 phosphate:H+ symporter [Spizellomyces punctatus DAOM BR117]
MGTQLAASALESSRFTRHHVKAVVVAGVGFLADQYDLFIINLIVPMLGYVYFASNHNSIPDSQKSILVAAVNLGAIIGQFTFGLLADKFGRKKMYGTELMIIIMGTVAGSLAGGGPYLSVVFTLGFWRFIQGVGIGADYPMSATIAAEFANLRNRGVMMAAVFSMQGFGLLFGVLVALIVLPCFKSAINENVQAFDHVWRIIMAAGLIPALLALYYRLTIPESPRYTSDITRDEIKALRDAKLFLKEASDEGSITVTECNPTAPVRFEHNISSFRAFFGQWKNAKLLMGTAGTWFLIDIALYGLGLNNSIILSEIGFAKGDTPYDSMLKIILGNLIISLLGNFPGYFAAAAVIDTMGRRLLQLVGFAALTVFYVVIASAYHQILDTSIALFVVIYTCAQFFVNFGPNVTTFIIPGEAFPTEWRATAHGISAACGKIGAFIASYAFTPVAASIGVNGTIGVLAGCMFLGFVLTYFTIPETKGLALDGGINGNSMETIDVVTERNDSLDGIQGNSMETIDGVTQQNNSTDGIQGNGTETIDVVKQRNDSMRER